MSLFKKIKETFKKPKKQPAVINNWGTDNLEIIIDVLKRARDEGKDIIIKFQGKNLYSMGNLDPDAIYMIVYGTKRADYLTWWGKKNKDLTYPQLGEKWDKMIENDVNGIYQGNDVENIISVCRLVNEGEFKEAEATLKEITGDGPVMSMVVAYSKNGPEFFRKVEPEKASEPKTKGILENFEKRNKKFEEELLSKETKEQQVQPE